MSVKHTEAEPRLLISRTALLHNARILRREVGDHVRICAILKADAYGHGAPIVDHVALIDERFRLHERRAEKIAGLIAQAPRSAHEIAHALWGNVAVTQAYLTLSEVLGHIDLLLRDGRVVEEEHDGLARFRTAS